MQAYSSLTAVSPTANRREVDPHIYKPSDSDWAPLTTAPTGAVPLARGELLRIISWNIDFSIPAHEERTNTALDYLASIFSQPSTDHHAPMVVMFQEMTDDSFEAIVAHSWVQENFIVSGPMSKLYFTLLLVDRRLVTADWFRIRYPKTMHGRDVLSVNVLVAPHDVNFGADGEDKEPPAQWVRFCTTHLESMPERPGYELRPRQLALVSSLLKEDSVGGDSHQILGGLVGGDMNLISPLDDEIHKMDNVRLRDAWEDHIKNPSLPGVKSDEVGAGKEDSTFGRAEGHTWGYQPPERWPARRFDRFFYTGDLEVVALEGMQDSSRGVARLGVGLRTEVDDWVSDHFGIAIGIKVPGKSAR